MGIVQSQVLAEQLFLPNREVKAEVDRAWDSVSGHLPALFESKIEISGVQDIAIEIADLFNIAVASAQAFQDM